MSILKIFFYIIWTFAGAAAFLGFMMIFQSAALHQDSSDIALSLLSFGLIFFLACCEIAWVTREKNPSYHESVRNPDNPATAYLPAVKPQGR